MLAGFWLPPRIILPVRQFALGMARSHVRQGGILCCARMGGLGLYEIHWSEGTLADLLEDMWMWPSGGKLWEMAVLMPLSRGI